MELVIGIVIGAVITFIGFKAVENRSLHAIEKDLTESYRGETFEKRAKRASK